MASKSGNFLVNYPCLEHGGSKVFFKECYLESLGSNKGELLCMERSLEGYFNYGQINEKRLEFW